MKKVIKGFFSILGLQVGRMPPKSPASDSKFVYQNNEPLAWLRKFDIGSIIDVGSNEGQFASKILKVLPDARVHCFEPIRDVYAQLVENFKDNKNVFTYNCGLGETNEELQININEYSASSSMLEMLDLHRDNFDFAVKVAPQTISVRKLDEVLIDLPAEPMLLKIDVQGYEMHVLKGGEKVAGRADLIIIETTFHPLYKGQPLFRDIYDWMLGAGFTYAGNMEQLLAPTDNQILQADAIFINNKHMGHLDEYR